LVESGTDITTNLFIFYYLTLIGLACVCNDGSVCSLLVIVVAVGTTGIVALNGLVNLLFDLQAIRLFYRSVVVVVAVVAVGRCGRL